MQGFAGYRVASSEGLQGVSHDMTITKATKTMFAITHVNTDGMRGLTFANHGRNHYETQAAAQEALELYKPGLREKVLGDRASTLEVRPVECYSHGDAVGVWFD